MNARIALAALLACIAAQPAGAAIVVKPLDYLGQPSGWEARYDDALVGVTVDMLETVGLTPGYVDIEIGKQFTDFVNVPVEFFQIAPNPVPVIRIVDETMANSTGRVWTDFHWELAGPATFSDPDDFYIGPFTRKILTATTLDVDLGVVGDAPPNNIFRPGDPDQPGGPLYIHPAIGQEPDFTSFTLIQYPTPEPGTMALLAVGGAALLRRRRRR